MASSRDEDLGTVLLASGALGALAIGLGWWTLSRSGHATIGPQAGGSGARSYLPVSFSDLDVEAVARMIASENPTGSRRLHVEQAWTQIRSAGPFQTLFSRITAGSGWGGQGESKPPGGTRPVATANSANDAQRQLAIRILSGLEQSEIPGAGTFWEPAQQDRAFAVAERARAKQKRGEPLTHQEQRLLKYKSSAEDIRRRWRARGQRQLDTIEGVEFWTA